ncbi:hypothetical protein ATANTOWER_009149 [Ataeniobius toweri]|uniref:Uncharacterized protein n=1 Tax=Ataeniobius toweri TaxID=208326 RepID=A0ABU7AEE8_9TELE|nr:hypothetical protein [Ataeniobius toweri]
MHVATVERKNSLLTGRNLQQNQAQCERPSATTEWGFCPTPTSLFRCRIQEGFRVLYSLNCEWLRSHSYHTEVV